MTTWTDYIDIPQNRRRVRKIKREIIRRAAIGVAISTGIIGLVWVVTTDKETRIAKDIMAHHTDILKFEVAGHKYEVRSPNIPLTFEQQNAWVNFAKKQGLPAYTADGPLAIDP